MWLTNSDTVTTFRGYTIGFQLTAQSSHWAFTNLQCAPVKNSLSKLPVNINSKCIYGSDHLNFATFYKPPFASSQMFLQEFHCDI